jgi:hypothetical protein
MRPSATGSAVRSHDLDRVAVGKDVVATDPLMVEFR